MEAEIDTYIKMCEEKKEYHSIQISNAMRWYNVLNLVSSGISSAQILSNTVMIMTLCSALQMSILNASLSFVVVGVNKLISQYGFLQIRYQHELSFNDFLICHDSFVKSKQIHNIDFELFDYNKYIKNIDKFKNACSRAVGNQHVCACEFFGDC